MKPFLFIVLSLFLVPGASHACTCTENADFSMEEYNGLDLIFTGRADSAYTDPVMGAGIRLKVIGTFKGDPGNGYVFVKYPSGTCGIKLEEGRHYLLFLYVHNQIPHINYCSRKVLIENIEQFSAPTWLTQCSNRKNGYQKIYHNEKVLSSEGLMKNGVPEGKWKYYHTNSKLKSKGSYVNGLKQGIWEYYDNAGNKAEKIGYRQNKVDGEYIMYGEKEKITSILLFTEGQLNGKSVYYGENKKITGITYYDHDKDTASYHYFEDGSPQHIETKKLTAVWYSNGQKQFEDYYSNGEITGSKRWREDGSLILHYLVRHDEEAIVYASNDQGEVMVKNGNGYYNLYGEEGLYKDTLKTGTWKISFNKGAKEEYQYIAGRKHGSSRKWSSNGTLLYERTFKNGEPNGPARYYYNNGEIQMERNFVNGENLLLNAWDPEGNQMVKDGNGTYQYYNDDGIKEVLSPAIYLNGKAVKK